MQAHTLSGPEVPRTGLGFKRWLRPHCSMTCSVMSPLPASLSSSVGWASSAHCPRVVGALLLVPSGAPEWRGHLASSSLAGVARSDAGQGDSPGGWGSDGPLMLYVARATPEVTETGLRTGAGTRHAPQTCQHPFAPSRPFPGCLPAPSPGRRKSVVGAGGCAGGKGECVCCGDGR